MRRQAGWSGNKPSAELKVFCPTADAAVKWQCMAEFRRRLADGADAGIVGGSFGYSPVTPEEFRAKWQGVTASISRCGEEAHSTLSIAAATRQVIERGAQAGNNPVKSAILLGVE